TSPHLNFSFEIDSFRVIRVEQEAPVTGLLPGDGFDMKFSTFIDVANYGSDDDSPRNVTPTKEVVGLWADIHIVIETRLFDLLDQIRPR
ncbi:MAG: hypothetical protein ACI8QF_002999, partial [Limisphaerales bacterium]